MKCLKCVEEGKTSSVYVSGPSSRTLMHVSFYYDENGEFHGHDPNISYYEMKCSNDHEISISSINASYCCDDVTGMRKIIIDGVEYKEGEMNNVIQSS